MRACLQKNKRFQQWPSYTVKVYQRVIGALSRQLVRHTSTLHSQTWWWQNHWLNARHFHCAGGLKLLAIQQSDERRPLHYPRPHCGSRNSNCSPLAKIYAIPPMQHEDGKLWRNGNSCRLRNDLWPCQYYGRRYNSMAATNYGVPLAHSNGQQLRQWGQTYCNHCFWWCLFGCRCLKFPQLLLRDLELIYFSLAAEPKQRKHSRRNRSIFTPSYSPCRSIHLHPAWHIWTRNHFRLGGASRAIFATDVSVPWSSHWQLKRNILPRRSCQANIRFVSRPCHYVYHQS